MSNEELLKNEEAENTAVASQESSVEQAAADSGETSRVVDSANADGAASVQKDGGKIVPKKQKRGIFGGICAMPAEKKRKLFGLIYYPVLALFFALMFIFSSLDGVSGYSPSAYDDGYYNSVNAHIRTLSALPRSSMVGAAGESLGMSSAREYIVSKLTEAGFTLAAEVKSQKDENYEGEKTQRIDTITGYAAGGYTVTLQTSALESDIQASANLSQTLVGATLTNIIAAIPSGKTNASSVIITVRYDCRPDTVGAADNAAFTANVLQTLAELKKQNKRFANDIIVVFTEDLDMSYGAYAFFQSFKGFDNAVSRAKVGISLDAYGNSGTLALTDSSNAGLDYINAYARIADNIFNSSVVPDSISNKIINAHAVKAFGKIPALQIAVLGGLYAVQSPLDTADNISQGIIRQQARLVKDYIQEFGNSSATFGADGSSLVYFSYIDGGTVAYTYVASYVIGALILAMIAAVITLLVLKKTFSLKNMLVAMGVQALVVLGTMIAMFGAYFMVTLMLTGFGALPINAILRIRYFNAGIMIAGILISVAAAFGFTNLFKKMFKVTSSDIVRGTAMLFGVAGAMMSFVSPAYSFMTSWLGLLMLAVLLTTVCVHKKFKAKFGFGMDKLYPYVLPVALCLPMIMAEVTMLATLLPLVLFPIIMTVFTAFIGVAVPYLDRTRPLLDKAVKKLPKRTIRVERVVTERVEDRAKKGKFTEKTFKRVEKEKVALNYKNYFGISVVAVLAIIIALFSGGFGVDFGKSITDYHSYNDAIYNDSLVYEISTDESGKTSQMIVIGDLMTYKFARYYVTGLEWEAANNRYVKPVSYNVNEKLGREPSISKSGNLYTVTTFNGGVSNVTLTIPSASAITRITVKELHKTSGEYKGYIYDFEKNDTITLRLPYGFDETFTMEIEGGSPSKILYEEYYRAAANDDILEKINEWNEVAGKSDMTGIRGGIVIKRTIKV